MVFSVRGIVGVPPASHACGGRASQVTVGHDIVTVYEHILKIDIEIDIVLNYKNRIENRSFTKNLESSQH